MNFILDPSLVLYLPLYQLEGASFMSQDAHGHLCTATGVLWRPNGRDFDGVDDRIDIPDHASLDITSALTLEAWVYHDIDATEMTLAKRDEASDDAYNLYVNLDGSPSFGIYVGGVQKEVKGTIGAVPKTTWLHIVGVYNGVDLRAYVNGVLRCTPLAETGSIDVTTDPVTVGWGFSNLYAWDGKIGEVRVYNRALTPQEILHNYLATKWRYR